MFTVKSKALQMSKCHNAHGEIKDILVCYDDEVQMVTKGTWPSPEDIR